MNKVLDPPGIKMVVQRMACTACGAEANASCTCGVAYAPKSIKAAEAIKANPEKSDRAIAKEIGATQPTVSEARKAVGAGDKSVITSSRTGRDGKSYPATRQPAVKHRAPEQPEDLIALAHAALTPVTELIRQMTPQQRTRFREQASERVGNALRDEPDTIYF